MMNRADGLGDWLDELQARGRYTFTSDEARDPNHGPGFSRGTLWRAIRAGRIASPRQGFYVLVPPEYRVIGTPPAEWFIDELMRQQKLPYYVGLLTAAALHGASAQASQEYQVIVQRQNRPVRPINLGRLRIRFYMRTAVDKAGVEQRVVRTGYVRVATPETVLLDLVALPHHAGGWDNVATVVRDLRERIEPQRLERELVARGSQAGAQRLGYILERVGASRAAEVVRTWLSTQRPRYVPLVPGVKSEGEINRDWHLMINRQLAPD